MATDARIEISSERYTRDRNGERFERVYTCQASSVQDALAAPGMPVYGDPIAGFDGLTLSGITSEQLTIATGEDGETKHHFKLRMEWTPPSGNIPPPSEQEVQWYGGTISRRILVDLDGEAIGERNFTIDGGSTYLAASPDDQAEPGADVAVPTVEAEVRLPIGPIADSFNPFNVALVLGRVNSTSMSIDGFSFAPGQVLFNGFNATSTKAGQVKKYNVSYRFTLVAEELPNLPAVFATTDAPYTPDFITAEHVAVPIYEPLKADGVLAAVKFADDGVTKVIDFEAFAQRRAVQLKIHRVAKRANMAFLGVS